MPKRKAAKKRTSAKRSTKKRGAPRKRRPRAVAVGDPVRLPPEVGNQIIQYDPKMALEARAAEAVEGIVCSIRSIRTGKYVQKTRGDLSEFVLEVLHSQTFRFQYSSERNVAGSIAADVSAENPVWLKFRSILQEASSRGDFAGARAAVLGEEPFSSLLDGWRVVKVRAEAVEPLA